MNTAPDKNTLRSSSTIAWLAASLWLAACTWTTASSDYEQKRGMIEDQWAEVMQQLDDDCKVLDKQLLRNPAGDLQLIADKAQACADNIRQGYGELNHEHVPGFARMSRDCESWFLQIALEARNNHRATAADLYRTGREQHCARCHDAYGAAK